MSDRGLFEENMDHDNVVNISEMKCRDETRGSANTTRQDSSA